MSTQHPNSGAPFTNDSFHSRFRRWIAAGLTFSFSLFTCIPPLAAQAAAPVSPSAASPVATIQPVTAKDSAKALDLYRKGAKALGENKSERAIALFSAAHKLDPGDGTYLAAYEIARQQQVGTMIQSAEEAQKQGELAAARKKLVSALNLDPGNPYVEEHLQSFASEDEPAVVSATPMPEFSSGLIELVPTVKQATFHLRGNAQDVLKKLFAAYGITPILDDSVPTKQIRIDLDQATLQNASTAAELTSGTFLVPLDAEHVLIAADTRQNRDKFQRLLLESVYLPGMNEKDVTEAANMIKTVFGIQQVSVQKNTGTMTVRAPEATLRAINETLSHLMIDRPEVMLDIHVYQLNDTRQQKLGVALPQSLNVFNVTSELNSIISQNQAAVQQIISSGLVNPGDLAGIAAVLIGLGLANGTVFNQPFALFGNGLTLSGLSFGSTTVNASLSISNTKELDHIQLRAGDDQKQTLMIGSKYPVITQSYSAGLQVPTGSTSLSSLLAGTQQPGLSTATNPLAIAPQVQYQDLGLKVEAMPHVLRNDDVQMKLKIELTALGGASVNGSPIINNRSLTTEAQVQDGGSALITGTVSRTESRSLSGIPGLSELPGFAWTASPETDVTVGKLLIVITPHILSATRHNAASPMIALAPGTTGGGSSPE